MGKKVFPYSRQYIDEDDIKSVIEVLKSSFLTTGPKVEEFENALANVLGVKHVVSVSSGTSALHLAALTLLDKHDKVLTTPNSFLATANTILYANALPIFIDVDKHGNIDLNLCEDYLKKDNSIKAIFAVDFAGNMVDPNGLAYLKEKYGVLILEDCAHALGAKKQNFKAGDCKICDVATFSFHPVKHITCAEGGAIATNNARIAKKVQMLRNHGINRNKDEFEFDGFDNPLYYEMQLLGFNYRLSDVQCALGLSQLKKLDYFLKRRKQLALRYNKAFQNTSIRPLYINPESAYHLYVVKIDFENLGLKRNDVMLKLKENGILTQVHYIPINAQPYYIRLGYKPLDTPKMMEYYKQCLSIPLYVGLTDEEQNFIIQSMLKIINK